jgi:hypothetical protein
MGVSHYLSVAVIKSPQHFDGLAVIRASGIPRPTHGDSCERQKEHSKCLVTFEQEMADRSRWRSFRDEGETYRHFHTKRAAGHFSTGCVGGHLMTSGNDRLPCAHLSRARRTSWVSASQSTLVKKWQYFRSESFAAG